MKKPGASRPKKQRGLTWRQERFVEAYVDNGGNATRASMKAGFKVKNHGVYGYTLLKKANVFAAVEEERSKLRAITSFTRERGLMMLLGMATARLSDFTEVMGDPGKKKSYEGLKELEYGLASGKKTKRTRRHDDGSTEETVESEIRIITPAERRAAINDLFAKLGLDKAAGAEDRISFLERFIGLGAKLGRSDSSGGSSGEEGST